MDQEKDRECLTRVQAGDSRALAELYDRYMPIIFPVVRRILRTGADAEDAIQDAWVHVLRRAATYDPKRGSVVAWLLMVARSRALDRYRSLVARGRAESKVDSEPANEPSGPPASAEMAQLSQRVRAAMAQLDPSQREVLEIAYFRGLSQSEIANHLGQPLGTVKSWTRFGLMRLRELLQEEELV